MSSFNDVYELNGTQKVLRAVVITSLTITAAFIFLRCFIRARLQSQFSVDDYLLIVALLALGTQSSLGLYAMDYGGFGRKTSELPRRIYLKGLRWLVLTECTYTLALMFAKLSIAFLQLRVMGLSTMTLRRMHHVSIGVNLFVGLYEFFTLLFQCYPDPEGAYQPVIIASADCTDRDPVVISVYIYSAVNIILDWYYSLAMVPLIWKLQNMKPVVKMSAILILGIGVFASVATIIRLKYLVGFADSRDPLLAIVPIGLWSWIEECLGMCAACIATFRPLLRLIPGLSSSSGGSGGSPPYHSGAGDAGLFVTWKSRLDGRRDRRNGLRLDDLEGGSDTDGGPEDDESEEQRGRPRESGTVIEYSEDPIVNAAAMGSEQESGPHAFRTHQAETASVATTKDGAEVMTVTDDAGSQKSMLRHKQSASGARDSWRTS